MQKTNNKGSILIWATFLSLIITITFISISTKINKNLKNYTNFTEEVDQQSEINNIINSGSINTEFTSQYLENKDKLIFSSKVLKVLGLNKYDSNTSKIIENSTLTIQVRSGGPLKYKNGTDEGIVLSSKNINVSPGDFVITNLGGYSSLIIKSSSDRNILTNETHYNVIKKIGNKEIIKSKGVIKNF